MLVLTRKKSEVIKIGNDIVIKVIRTGKTTVKLGIEAPEAVRVLRGELCDHGSSELVEVELEDDEQVHTESPSLATLVV